ncbi:hypothetical protein Y032_0272g938 [Ancylostoma ceylanicum]|uniref:Uncharacterized protein n=1 Tax=Ancylostoma ceylanicum TaxID=53326 RepID=A0A016S872_9BILA|nr:hypothetical protein Y032_0272g938 [Ancylostoma ceylanicum]
MCKIILRMCAPGSELTGQYKREEMGRMSLYRREGARTATDEGRAGTIAGGLRQGLEVEITLCKESTSVATVRRFLKFEKSLETGPTRR